MQFPLRLVLLPSKYLLALLLLLHIAAFTCLFPLQASVWLKFVTASLLVLSAVVSIRHYANLSSPHSVCELLLLADGSLEVVDRAGTRSVASIAGESTMLAGMVVLLLKRPESRRLKSVVIFPDALTVEEHRALCAWLRWKIPIDKPKTKINL